MPDLQTAIWAVVDAVLPDSQNNATLSRLYLALTDFADAIQRDTEAKIKAGLSEVRSAR